jgi:hypothetical protein
MSSTPGKVTIYGRLLSNPLKLSEVQGAFDDSGRQVKAYKTLIILDDIPKCSVSAENELKKLLNARESALLAKFNGKVPKEVEKSNEFQLSLKRIPNFGEDDEYPLSLNKHYINKAIREYPDKLNPNRVNPPPTCYLKRNGALILLRDQELVDHIYPGAYVGVSLTIFVMTKEEAILKKLGSAPFMGVSINSMMFLTHGEKLSSKETSASDFDKESEVDEDIANSDFDV